MGLRIAFQMDPLANINIDEDTTFRIAEEAQKREHSLFHFLPENLEFVHCRVTEKTLLMDNSPCKNNPGIQHPAPARVFRLFAQ